VIALALLVLAATILVWGTVRIAQNSFGHRPLDSAAGGPLTYPAPRNAGTLPIRDGRIPDASQRKVIAAFRQRFANFEARERAGGAHPIRPAGLYGLPGHIDPATGKPSWVMYLGLGVGRSFGDPADTVTRLMAAVLGPGSMVGPWPVPAGPRGGRAECTIAVLGAVRVSVCGWATVRTVGAIVSPARATPPAELAALMLPMRYNLQHRAA
jgi:hypothetical protein